MFPSADDSCFAVRSALSSTDENEKSNRVRQIVADVRATLQSGRAVDIEQVLSRHPDLAQVLEPILSNIHATSSDEQHFLALGPEVALSDSSVHAEEATVNWHADSPPDSASSQNAHELTRAHVHGSSSVSPVRPAIHAPPVVGTRIGEYRLLRPIGKGGMGEVFEAEEVKTGKKFALKLLSSQLPRSEQTVDRFLNEASLAASLSHPRTTFVYGAGQEAGQFYIAMELMPGHTIKDQVEQEGPPSVSQAIDIVLDILDGLEAAHRRGVIHRDLKPSNCFVDADGRIKVGDFGLAKSLIAGADITQSGTFLGTPQFAAPEQIRHASVDQRTDLFAVGATLYYILTGQPPYTGDPAAVIAQIVADPPPRIRSLRPEIPPTLERIIARSLSKLPKRRYQTADEMRQALLPFSSHGVSMSDVGRRMGAFLFDLLIVMFIVGILTTISAVIRQIMRSYDYPQLIYPKFTFFANVSLALIPYFAITEAFWGNSLAKHRFGIHVVNTYGESPALWRSLLRACVFPGLFLATVDVAESLLITWPPFVEATKSIIESDLLRYWLVPEFFLGCKVALCVVCFATMSRENGYRGLHELISGTRVVRKRQEDLKKSVLRTLSLRNPVSQPDPAVPERLGAYRVLGRIGQRGDVKILVGQDEALSRPVWLHWSDQGLEVGNASRSTIDRGTRQRWLPRGNDTSHHWQALEAIDGGCLVGILARDGALPWEVGRVVLPELAQELVASLEDGSLPRTLYIDQLWVDSTGHLRLLDFPLHNQAIGEHDPAYQQRVKDQNDMQRAWLLFSEIALRCRLDLETPGQVSDYLATIHHRTGDLDVLRSAGQRLHDLAKVPFRLGWDGRLGMVAVALGVEMVLITSWCLAFGWLSTVITGTHIGLAMALASVFGLVLPASLGFLCNGGVAFALSGFETRTMKTRRASRIRSALRNIVAWLPLTIPQAIFNVSIFLLAAVQMQTRGNLPSDNGPPDEMWPLIVGWIVVAAPIFGMLVIAATGFLYAMISPRRGLQDRIAGTYLVHK